MATYFVGIGGQRCGSTWLARYLAAHPQVCWPLVKELHVFDHRFVPELTIDTPRVLKKQAARTKATLRKARGRWLGRSHAVPLDVASTEALLRSQQEVLQIVETADWSEAGRLYRAFFDRQLGPEHRCFGEITPGYATLPTAGFESILTLYPDARLLFVLRDPVDRFWSGVRHAESRRGSARSIDACLGDERLLRRSRYDLTFAALDPVVPPDQLLVVFYEDLFGPDDTAMRRITAFLGIDDLPGDRVTRVNDASFTPMDSDHETEALRLFEATYRTVESRLGSVPERWRARMARL